MTVISRVSKSIVDDGVLVVFEVGDDIYSQTFDTMEEADTEIERIITESNSTRVTLQ